MRMGFFDGTEKELLSAFIDHVVNLTEYVFRGSVIRKKNEQRRRALNRLL
jgi:hypothetical protein